MESTSWPGTVGEESLPESTQYARWMTGGRCGEACSDREEKVVSFRHGPDDARLSQSNGEWVVRTDPTVLQAKAWQLFWLEVARKCQRVEMSHGVWTHMGAAPLHIDLSNANC